MRTIKRHSRKPSSCCANNLSVYASCSICTGYRAHLEDELTESRHTCEPGVSSWHSWWEGARSGGSLKLIDNTCRSETCQSATRPTRPLLESKARLAHFLVNHHCLYNTSYIDCRMARGIEGNEIATPRVPKLQKSTSSASQSGKQQKSILGFFQRKTAPASSPAAPTDTAAASSPPPQSSPAPANHNGKENGVLHHDLISLLNN